jgi:hypothetical protein
VFGLAAINCETKSVFELAAINCENKPKIDCLKPNQFLFRYICYYKQI